MYFTLYFVGNLFLRVCKFYEIPNAVAVPRILDKYKVTVFLTVPSCIMIDAYNAQRPRKSWNMRNASKDVETMRYV